MDSTRVHARLRERLKEATRTTILDAAEEMFARDGVQRARMEDVASHAGVAVGTLYNYFADREALVDALLDARSAELLALIDEALTDKKQPFEARLEAFLQAMVGHFLEHAGMFAVHMESELVVRVRARKAPMLRTLLERTTRLIRDGVAAGSLRSEDSELLPLLLIGMLRGAFMRHIYGIGEAPAANTAKVIARTFLRGAGKGGSR